METHNEGTQCTTALKNVGMAVYGSGTKFYDVTNLVKDMENNGTVNFAVDYAWKHWVDPTPYVGKTLTITRFTPVAGDFFTEGKTRMALWDPSNGRHTFEYIV